MFKQIWNMMCEDDDNNVADPLRAGFLAGMAIYLVGGIALIFALVHKVLFTPDHGADLMSFGGAMAAWAGGLGLLLTGTGGALWMKSKGDALPDALPPKK